MQGVKNLTIFGLALICIFLSGCISNNRITKTSTMMRTVGIGENAMPIDSGSFSAEFFNSRAESIDMVNEINNINDDFNIQVTEKELVGQYASEPLRYYGFNLRYGIDNSTEIKIGGFTGEIDELKEGTSAYLLDDITSTDFNGVNVGLKRLLTEYENPHRVSLYADFQYFRTFSEESVEDFDGNVYEFKPALIYGFLPKPENRTFTSFALYYSNATTKRNATVQGLPQEDNHQAIGGEINLTVKMGYMYPMVIIGGEKMISTNNNDYGDDVNLYLAMKLGLNFMRSNHE